MLLLIFWSQVEAKAMAGPVPVRRRQQKKVIPVPEQISSVRLVPGDICIYPEELNRKDRLPEIAGSELAGNKAPTLAGKYRSDLVIYSPVYLRPGTEKDQQWLRPEHPAR